jgi:hypothetical protein
VSEKFVSLVTSDQRRAALILPSKPLPPPEKARQPPLWPDNIWKRLAKEIWVKLRPTGKPWGGVTTSKLDPGMIFSDLVVIDVLRPVDGDHR